MYRAFHERFPDIGVSETRTVIQFAGGRVLDTFLFLELYCDEVGCDCRRVIVKVYSERQRRAGGEGLLASLTFGWESEQFYRDWARHPLEPYELEELKGPALQLLAPQSERAGEMLGHFRTILAEPGYVDRLRRHYTMFQASVAADPPKEDEPVVSANRAQRRGARRSKAEVRAGWR